MANTINFDPVAWSVDGGRHRGELLRTLAYAATSGAEGIVSTADCKVHQLTTPGTQIAIDAGALLIRNRSANVRNQTYVANSRGESRLDVLANGPAQIRHDLVVVRVRDPQYAPWGGIIPAGVDPASFQYVEPIIIPAVPFGTSTAAELNLGYSAVALARLELPANTTTVTNAMIKDVRRVAQPRSETNVTSWRPGDTAQEVPAGPGQGWALFPSMQKLIYCPEWATQLKIVTTVGNLNQNNGPFTGGMRAEYGWNLPGNPHIDSQIAGLHYEQPAGLTNRGTVTMGGEVAIPTSFRGKSHYLRIGADINAGSVGYPRADRYTTVTSIAEFVEIAE